MIDFFHVDLPFVLDGEAYRNVKGHERPSRPRRHFRQAVRSRHWLTMADLIIGPDSVQIKVCPAKVLGTWNCYGSSDLRQLVTLVVPDVLAALGHRVSDEQHRQLVRGEYDIRGVHIAHQFHLVNFSHSEFVRKVRHALSETFEVEGGFRGVGTIIKPRNRRASFYLYDKLLEFGNRAYPALREAIEDARDQRKPRKHPFFMAIERNIHLAAAMTGPRLELRLGDKYFPTTSEYRKGSGWRPGTARVLYERELRTLDLPGSVGMLWNRDEAHRLLTPTQYATLRLWHHGEPFASLGSKSTLQRHRQAILETLGVDIAYPSAKLARWPREVPIGSVLNVGNIVEREHLDDPDIENEVHDRLRELRRGSS
jgi:hypothetical protein